MQPIAENVWQVEGPDLRMPGGVWMPSRCTVFRLPDRSLVMYSPVAFGEDDAAAIAQLGEVAHIVAPSKWHHLAVGAAAARWPRATVHGAPGLRDKRPDLHIDRELGASFAPVLDVEVVAGVPKLNEGVLFHRPSGTLACADLVFHITRPANLRTRLVLAMMGVGGGRLAQSRAWRFLRRDRAAARGSIERILAWPIARIAPCHGEPIEIDAAALATRFRRIWGGPIAAAALAA
jgi:hypothetical protein